jgi:hypothetical protein
MSENDRPFRWLGCAVEEVPEPAEPPSWVAAAAAAEEDQ